VVIKVAAHKVGIANADTQQDAILYYLNRMLSYTTSTGCYPMLPRKIINLLCSGNSIAGKSVKRGTLHHFITSSLHHFITVPRPPSPDT